MNPPAGDLVILTTVENEMEASSMIGLFDKEKIELFMEGGSDLALFGDEAGEVTLIVHKKDYDRAKRLLEEIEADNEDFNWDDVDVGEPED